MKLQPLSFLVGFLCLFTATIKAQTYGDFQNGSATQLRVAGGSSTSMPFINFERNTLANLQLKNIIGGGYLEIGVATNNGDFASLATSNDVVFRALGGNNDMIFALPDGTTSNNRAIRFTYNYKGLLTVMGSGKVGIGVADSRLLGADPFRLYVKGGIRTEQVKVDVHSNWPDYVFDPSYQLLSIHSLRNYIELNHHLPNVPSAKEIKENGNNLGEMDAILLEKIEELTLYTLQQQELIENLVKSNEAMKLQIENLSNNR